jgi:transcriptional regulator with XRE-family HTH domain
MELCLLELDCLGRNGYAFRMLTTLAQNIAALHDHVGGTQASFAESVGAKQPDVSKWKRGTVPSTRTLELMAQLAGVSIASFQDEPWSPDNAPAGPTLISLPVNLPSVAALTRMFEALIGDAVSEEKRDELARRLAQRLPNGLSRAVSSPAVPQRGSTIAPDEDAQPRATRRQPRLPEQHT